jgi:F-type H+-transporting ATPase subunit c
MKIRKTMMSAWVIVMSLAATSAVLAQEAGMASAGLDKKSLAEIGLRAIGAGFAIGVAAFGAAIGMGIAVSGTISGMARNPNLYGKLFTSMILGLALIESLAIYALLIAFMIKP